MPEIRSGWHGGQTIDKWKVKIWPRTDYPVMSALITKVFKKSETCHFGSIISYIQEHLKTSWAAIKNLTRMTIIKKYTNKYMLERVWRKGNPPTVLVGMKTGTTTMANNMEVPWKLKTELPYHPAIPLLGIYPEIITIQKDMYTPVFTATLFARVKTQKQPKCSWTDEWIKRVWYIYTVEYYSTIKKNESMPFAATWMDLGIITLK